MKSLSLISGIDFSSNKTDCVCYSFDSSIADNTLPKYVAWPKSTDEVIKIVKFSVENNLTIIPRGAGTGMAGATIPTNDNTIVISLEKLRRLINIDTKNLNVMLEPGIINKNLQDELNYCGYFYPPDPSSLNICTIGGNVATNAGGPSAIKYGVTKNYVLAIEAVLSDGSLVNFGGKTHKKTVGYNIKDLLVGSEGTLAIFTKIRLKILPQPEDIITLFVLFDDIEMAGRAVSKIIASKIIPKTVELLDKSAIQVIEGYNPEYILFDKKNDIDAALLIELDGYPFTVQKEAEKIVDICEKFRGVVSVAQDNFSRNQLWQARRNVSPAIMSINKQKINEDIVVPINKVSETLKFLRQLSENRKLQIITFGHAGDGNIHINIMVEKNNPQEFQIGMSSVKEIFTYVIKIGGSISGEHGIGILKSSFIGLEIQDKEMQLMKDIKKLFDKENRLNPNKIFG